MPRISTLERQFKYLDDLRESGITNMFGASTYLESAFSLPRRRGTKILAAWMKTFDGISPVKARAELAKPLLKEPEEVR